MRLHDEKPSANAAGPGELVSHMSRSGLFSACDMRHMHLSRHAICDLDCNTPGCRAARMGSINPSCQSWPEHPSTVAGGQESTPCSLSPSRRSDAPPSPARDAAALHKEASSHERPTSPNAGANFRRGDERARGALLRPHGHPAACYACIRGISLRRAYRQPYVYTQPCRRHRLRRPARCPARRSRRPALLTSRRP